MICYNDFMKVKRPALQAKKYSKNNPKKAKIIELAVKRGIKEYAETFRRLATI